MQYCGVYILLSISSFNALEEPKRFTVYVDQRLSFGRGDVGGGTPQRQSINYAVLWSIYTPQYFVV
jgi:hypothetical protein